MISHNPISTYQLLLRLCLSNTDVFIRFHSDIRKCDAGVADPQVGKLEKRRHTFASEIVTTIYTIYQTTATAKGPKIRLDNKDRTTLQKEYTFLTASTSFKTTGAFTFAIFKTRWRLEGARSW